MQFRVVPTGLLGFFSGLGNGVANRADIAADASDRVARRRHQRRGDHDGEKKFAHVVPLGVVPSMKDGLLRQLSQVGRVARYCYFGQPSSTSPFASGWQFVGAVWPIVGGVWPRVVAPF